MLIDGKPRERVTSVRAGPGPETKKTSDCRSYPMARLSVYAERARHVTEPVQYSKKKKSVPRLLKK